MSENKKPNKKQFFKCSKWCCFKCLPTSFIRTTLFAIFSLSTLFFIIRKNLVPEYDQIFGVILPPMVNMNKYLIFVKSKLAFDF